MIFILNSGTNVTGVSNIMVKNSLQPKNVILKPGVNSIDSEVWLAMKNIANIKDKLENGILKVALEGGEAEVVSSTESLDSLHYTQANKIIKSTFDIELLNKWRNNETRTAVLKSLDMQLKTMGSISPANSENEIEKNVTFL